MNNSFIIEEEIIEQAQNICNYIDESLNRSRAAASYTAAKIAQNYFDEIEIDITSGIHNIPQVLERFNIADIYVNNAYIDVRLYFKEEEMCVPKEHFDLGVLPIAYMFIKLTEDLCSGEVSGFIPSNAINIENIVGDYYKVDPSDLVSYYDIESLSYEKNNFDVPENFEIQMYEYLDNRLSDSTTFYNTLLSSKEAREKFIDIANSQQVLQIISWNKEVDTKNNTLEFVEFGDTQENSQQDEMEFDNYNLENDVELENIDLHSDNTMNLDFDLNEEPLEDLALEHEFVETTLEDDSNETTAFVELDNSEPITNTIKEEEKEDENLDLPEENNNETLDFIEDFAEDDNQNEIVEEAFSNIEELEYDESFDTEYSYSTETTPSLSEVESNLEEIVQPSQLEELLEEENEEEKADDDTLPDDIETIEDSSSNDIEIDSLFGAEVESGVEEEESSQEPVKQKQSSKLLPLICLVGVISALGYYGHTHFSAVKATKEKPLKVKNIDNIKPQKQKADAKPVAMPIETVENTPKETTTNEGTGISIPAIEQNLGASIMISNLNVNWEVPAGYTTSTTAKRYLTKMGKIIQLNLKTELLLLSKPPISNRITVELVYNNNLQQFEVKEITSSSGEKTIDDVITQTIKNALKINLNMNMNTFNNISGNPILVIRL